MQLRRTTKKEKTGDVFTGLILPVIGFVVLILIILN